MRLRCWKWCLGGVQSREPIVPWEWWGKRSPRSGEPQVAQRLPGALGVASLGEDAKQTRGWIVVQA